MKKMRERRQTEVPEEWRSNGLRCFGHLQRRDSRYWTKDPENGAARKRAKPWRFMEI